MLAWVLAALFTSVGLAPMDGVDTVAGETLVAAPQVVVLIPSGMRETLAAELEGALEAQLAGLDFALRIEPGPNTEPGFDPLHERARLLASREPELVLVTWLVVHEDASSEVYLIDPRRSDRAFLREFAPAGTSEQAIAETTALVIRRAVLTLAQGGELDAGSTVVELQQPSETQPPLEPQPQPQSQPQPLTPLPSSPTQHFGPLLPEPDAAPDAPDATSPPRAATTRFWATVSYTGGNFAPELAWHGGVSLKLAWRHSNGTQLGLGYAVLPAIRVLDPALSTTLGRHPIELFAGYRALWSRLTLGADLGISLDLVSRSTVPTALGVPVGGRPIDPMLALVPRVDFGWAALPSVWLMSSLALEAYPLALDYAATIDGSERVLIRPSQVRAQLRIGVAFSF